MRPTPLHALLASCIATTAAAGELDQSNVALPDGAGTAVGLEPLAQVVTFDSSGTLAEVSLAVRRFESTDSDLVVDVREVVNGRPTDVVLGSVTVDVVAIAHVADPLALTSVDLSSLGITVAPGDMLAIGFAAAGDDVLNVRITEDTASPPCDFGALCEAGAIGITGAGMPAYAGGSLFQRVSGSWIEFENFTKFDVRFQAFVEAPPPGLDQQNIAASTSGTAIGTESVAQVITVGRAGMLDAVDFGIRRFANTPGDLRLRVLDASTGAPGTTVLAEVTVPNAAVSLQTEEFTRFEIPGGLAVTAGQRLALAVSSPTWTSGGSVFPVALTPATAYGGGNLYLTYPGANGWQIFSNVDTRFRTFLDIADRPAGLDQQNIAASTSGTAIGTESVAQVITVGRAGMLDAVDFGIRRFANTPGDLRLRVLDASTGAPGTTVLAEVTVPNAAVSLQTEEFTRFEIPGGLAVTAGQRLALAVSSPTWTSGGSVFPVALTPATAYGGGNLYLTYPGANGWQIFSNVDTRFRTFLDIADRPAGLDQQNIAASTSGTAIGTESVAQVITVGRAGMLDAVDFGIRRFANTPGDLRLRVLDASTGAPGTTVLAEVTVPNAAVSLQTEEFTRFEIPGGLAVTAGQRLALAVSSPTWTSGGSVFPVALTPATAYGGGNLYLTYPGANGWQIFSNVDTRFRTFLDIGSAPMADAGPPFTVRLGDAAGPSARRTMAAPGSTLSWNILSAPPGSNAALDHAESDRPRLTVDMPGRWELELVVTDPSGRIDIATTSVVAIDESDACPDDPAKSEPGFCGCGIADVDSDGDATLDCQDGCPTDATKTAAGVCGCGTADVDSDGDATLDCQDGCPTDAGKIAAGVCGCGTADADTDGDATLDCQDGCPTDASKTAAGVCGCGTADADTDGDATLDCQDGCPTDAGKIAAGVCGCGTADADTDGDATLDCQDGCPTDAGKIAAGVCGCGTADADSDGDATLDCQDGCPTDASKTAAGVCGCGTADADTDGDATLDCQDGCPTDASKTAAGVCGCGTADVDTDGDATLDCQDGCPTDASKTAAGVCGCGTADVDTDGDATLDCQDGCPTDASKTTAGVCGCGTADVDSDGDATLDCQDGCPTDASKTAAGVCGCGTADVDTDGDATLDCQDGCPNDATKTAAGVCGCGTADVDSDGDATLDCQDACPADPGDDLDADGLCADVDGCPSDAPGPTDIDGDGCPDSPVAVAGVLSSELVAVAEELAGLIGPGAPTELAKAYGDIADATQLLSQSTEFDDYVDAIALLESAAKQLEKAAKAGADVTELAELLSAAVDAAIATWLAQAEELAPGSKDVTKAAKSLDEARTRLEAGDLSKGFKDFEKATRTLSKIL